MKQLLKHFELEIKYFDGKYRSYGNLSASRDACSPLPPNVILNVANDSGSMDGVVFSFSPDFFTFSRTDISSFDIEY